MKKSRHLFSTTAVAAATAVALATGAVSVPIATAETQSSTDSGTDKMSLSSSDNAGGTEKSSSEDLKSIDLSSTGDGSPMQKATHGLTLILAIGGGGMVLVALFKGLGDILAPHMPKVQLPAR